MWEYIGIASLAGGVWSLLNFINKVASVDKETRWKDWDWMRFARTIIMNAIGSGVGLMASIYVLALKPTIPLAVGAGLFGEKGIEFAISLFGRVFPPK